MEPGSVISAVMQAAHACRDVFASNFVHLPENCICLGIAIVAAHSS